MLHTGRVGVVVGAEAESTALLLLLVVLAEASTEAASKARHGGPVFGGVVGCGGAELGSPIRVNRREIKGVFSAGRASR